MRIHRLDASGTPREPITAAPQDAVAQLALAAWALAAATQAHAQPLAPAACDGVSGCVAILTAQDGALLASVYAPQHGRTREMLRTICVARTVLDGDVLWPLVTEAHNHEPQRMAMVARGELTVASAVPLAAGLVRPPEPWCAAKIPVHVPVLPWLDRFEQNLAWAWCNAHLPERESRSEII